MNNVCNFITPHLPRCFPRVTETLLDMPCRFRVFHRHAVVKCEWLRGIPSYERRTGRNGVWGHHRAASIQVFEEKANVLFIDRQTARGETGSACIPGTRLLAR